MGQHPDHIDRLNTPVAIFSLLRILFSSFPFFTFKLSLTYLSPDHRNYIKILQHEASHIYVKSEMKSKISVEACVS